MNTSPDAPLAPQIDARYLLVLFGVPLWRAADGRRYVDRLWAKDLLLHLSYLPRLTLCCYERPQQENTNDLVCLEDDARFQSLRTIGLPQPANLVDALLRSPWTAALLWSEIGRCSIVHSSVAGWPLPEAWFLTPLLRWRRRPHVIIVESAFWRLPSLDRSASLLRKGWSRLKERLARVCLDRAELAIFTQDGYRQSLLSEPRRGYVIEASWLDAEGIVDPASLAEMQAIKRRRPGLRVAFFGRLTREKGVLDVVTAGVRLLRAGLDIQVDVYGEGPIREAVAQLASQGIGGRVVLCPPLPYGTIFFTRLRDYDAVIVPTHSDEQPRIVFDAYSQGVPVLASDTTGHRQCVTKGETGAFFPAGDVEALERALRLIAADKEGWLTQGQVARLHALRHTHQAMHDQRRRLLEQILGHL